MSIKLFGYMKNFNKHIINNRTSIRKALSQISSLKQTLTLFVVNEKNQLLGTLTDGDIRRGFVLGNNLNDSVDKFITRTYHFLNNGIDVKQIKRLKEGGIGLLPVVNDKKEIIKVYNLQELNSVLPLDAVIMAGGRGERLRPLTDKVPKPMLKIGDKPIIEHTIDRLISYGIEKIYITVNYLKEQIIDFLGDGEKKGIEIKYIEEDEPLGTAGSLSLIDDLSRDIIVTNSDLFTNINYEHLYLSFYDQQADMAIASIPYTINIPYAILEEKNNVVKNFKEKPSNTHYANAGIYIIKKKIVKAIPKKRFYNMTDLMQNLIDNKMLIIHNPLIGYWIDIGKHDDLNKARDIVKHLS